MSPEHTQQFWEYLARAANFLVNTPDDEPPTRPSLDLAPHS
jgi:hypothetical protein